MAAPLCDPPLVNRFPPVSSFSPKSFLANENYRLETHIRSSFLGAKSLQMFRSAAKTSKLGSNGRRRMLAMASLGGFLGGMFKGTDTGESTRQQYAPTVTLINGLEAEMSALSDSKLREKTSSLKERAQMGESLDSLLPVSFLVAI